MTSCYSATGACWRRNAVYARVVQRGRAVLVGAPPAPVAAELERLWKATYRSDK